MSLIDVEALLTEISAEAPCGEDLRYDPTYQELERISQGTPEREMGEARVAAEEPDWRAVGNLATELFARTKDLRVTLRLTLAAMNLEGLPGLRDGLALLRGLLERYWQTVHPQLDPEDNNDPQERINIIVSLAPPAGGYQDPMRFARRVREATLCSSRQLGRFSLHDILIATGQLAAPEGVEPVETAVIDAAFEDTDLAELEATASAVTGSLDHVRAIDQVLTEYVGADQAPNLGPFIEVVEDVARHLEGHLAKRGIAGAPVGEAPAGPAAAAPAGAVGELRSREDVITVLGKVCQYFERYEPSSPIPLLVRRAQRLVAKSFLEIMQDISPGTTPQINLTDGIEGGAGQEQV